MKKIYFLSFFMVSLINYSQNKTDSLYTKYFEANREITYLHLNKTTIVKGENLWFKAYIINQKNGKLSDFTRNLYCLIYDDDGKLKDKKLLYVEHGVASGFFSIDSSFTKKNYFIKTSTNWMKNFKEDNSFIQRIDILDSKKFEQNKKSEVSNYEIQFLPEGGNAISNISNNYGILIKNQNNIGIKIKKGEILDNQRKVLETFKTNKFGLGKVNFYQKPNTSYISRITFDNGTTIEKGIPTALDKGIALQVENNLSTILRVSVLTNGKTLQNIKHKTFSLFVHNTNTTFTKKFNFDKQETTINIFFPKNQLNSGINIITLLDELNKPIAERLIFNRSNSMFSNIDVSASIYNKDSVTLSLKKDNQLNETTFLSASILPNNTISYQPNNNIASKFLLKPFIKGDIQNSKYYFTNINNKKLAELDLLLQTQGWSKYAWNDIFNNTPNYNFENENGISLEGELNMKRLNSKSHIFLFSGDNDLALNTTIKNSEFSFRNLFLRNNSRVHFIVSRKKRNNKTQGYFKEFPYNISKEIKVPKNINTNNKMTPFTSINFKNFIDNKVEVLDTVVINSKPKPKEKPIFLESTFRNVFLFDKNYRGTLRLDNFLRERMYYVRRNLASDLFIYRNRKPVTIFLDGFNLNGMLDIISNSLVSDFSEIHFGNREIFFYTNYNFYKPKPNQKFSSLIIKNGFSEDKKYYSPKYNTESKLFTNYGAIFWKPDIVVNKVENTINFRTPLLDQESFTIYIEGITNSGKLISTKKTIKVKETLN